MAEIIDWKKLSAPTPKSEIKFRPLAGKQIKYVDARFVMDRLDSVIGSEGWHFAWSAVCMPTDKHPGCIKGTLTIKYGPSVADTVSKSDVGEYEVSKMSSMKGGVSDALKRCAVQFGIGRDLYVEESALLVQMKVPEGIKEEEIKSTVQKVFTDTIEETKSATQKLVSRTTETEDATVAQLKYLTTLSNRFDFIIPENVSKKQASELIKKYSEMPKPPERKVNLNDPNNQVDIPF